MIYVARAAPPRPLPLHPLYASLSEGVCVRARARNPAWLKRYLLTGTQRT